MDTKSVLMNIMLLGSNGQLGKELNRHLSEVGTVSAYSRTELDISNEQAVREAVLYFQPDIIINAAAYTAVDKAEINKKHAYTVNAYSVANLAQLVKAKRVWLIHYSTDYVFDGTKSDPYDEKDLPKPINIYGASKLAGENLIIDSNCRHLIFRLSWVIGKDGHNFAKSILRLALNRDNLKVVCDQVGVPTTPSLISKITVDAIRAIQEGRAWQQGIYHLAPRGVSNWFEIAQTLLEFAKSHQVLLRTNADDLQSIKTAEYPTIAKRPLNSLFETQKLKSQLSFDLPFWKDEFLLMAKDIIKELSTDE